MDMDVVIKARFIGRVECVVDGAAIVSIYNEVDDDWVVDAEYQFGDLTQYGISDGDEFILELLKNKDGITPHFYRIKPKQLSMQQINNILKEISNINI